MGGSMRGRITAIIVGAAVMVGGYAATQQGGGGAEASANVFAVPPSSADGTTTCVRSSTLKTYSEALAANAVCKGNGSTYTSWEKACAAATGGDIIGVVAGEYAPVGGGSLLLGAEVQGGGADCSDGQGEDYDPNWEEKGGAEADLSDWVRFVPASDANCPNVTLSGVVSIAYGDWHAIIDGGCFDFNHTIYIHDGSTTAIGRPQNLIFQGTSSSDTMEMFGIEIRGAKNIMFKHVDYGPNVQCAANDANATPAYFRCDPSGEDWEAFYATKGTNAAGCTTTNTALCAGFFGGGSPAGANEFVEPFIHSGACFGQTPVDCAYNNIRFEDFHIHDGQARGTGSGVHPGCFMYDGIFGISGLPAHNMVFDGASCERQVIGVQNQDSGVTWQNSYLGCPVLELNNSSPQGKWDVCSTPTTQASIGLACRADQTDPDCVISNVLFRYNVFFANPGPGLLINTPSATFGTYSNVRVVANVFLSDLQGCSISGVTCANNSFFGVSTAGSSATTLSCDPLVDSEQGTPDDLWRESTQLDPRLSGASCGVPTLDLTTLGADYDLPHTIDRIARGSTSTKPGVDE